MEERFHERTHPYTHKERETGWGGVKATGRMTRRTECRYRGEETKRKKKERRKEKQKERFLDVFLLSSCSACSDATTVAFLTLCSSRVLN